MTKQFLISILCMVNVVGLLLFARIPAGAQGTTAPPKSQWARDFNGVWSAVGAQQDITANLLPGEEVSLTPFGAEQYNKIDEADSPAYKCEPYGPTRIMSSALPFMIFQQDKMIGMAFEHIDYRLIYMNGKHPDDILDYPEWEGNSIGRWDGDSLVVDTIGMREESWLDSFGLQHSGKMHMVERYTKTSPDTYIWKVTIDDPVYFTKPFTYAVNFERDEYRIVPDRCADTPPDEKYTLNRGRAGPRHKVPPTFPPGVARTYIGANKATVAEAEGENDAEAGAGGRLPRQNKPIVKKTKFEEDTVKTSRGDLKITSIANYSLMFTFNGKVVDVDPVGRLADYSSLPKADLILVTHDGPNHLDPDTVKALSTNKTALVVCPNCSLYLPTGTVMINDETETVAGFKIEAVPAYNIKGRGGNGKPVTPRESANGYIITFGDKRVYVASETENVPEVKSLKEIDVAFLPVNNTGIAFALRTMTPAMFEDTVKAMQPKIVFPYAYGNNDPKALADLVKDDKGVEIRVRGLS
jgi:L-ascorbate metabolism protein UlaG (beta-lactamase superfamily)